MMVCAGKASISWISLKRGMQRMMVGDLGTLTSTRHWISHKQGIWTVGCLQDPRKGGAQEKRVLRLPAMLNGKAEESPLTWRRNLTPYSTPYRKCQSLCLARNSLNSLTLSLVLSIH